MFIQEKKYKIYETWFVHNKINFKELNYSNWKKNFIRMISFAYSLVLKNWLS